MQFSKEPTVFRCAASEHDDQYALDWNELEYLVGDDAYKRSRYCSSISNVEDLLYYYELFIKWYERKFNTKFYAITLPYSVFANATDLIEELKARLGVETIVGQGLAALEYLVATNNAEEGKTTLLIDGGFNTINILIVKGNEVTYSETYYNQVGTRDLIENYFKPLVRKRIPDISANPLRLDEVLRNAYTDFNFERIGFEEEKTEAVSRYISDVFRQIKSGMSTELIDFEQVAIVGGLAYYISPTLIETSKSLIIPSEHSEFLNVLGASLSTGYKPALDLGFGYAKVVK